MTMMDDDKIDTDDFGLDSDTETEDSVESEGSDQEEETKNKSDQELSSGRLERTDISKLKMILDVPLKVSVELGRTKMLVNDLLQLGQGSVIELDKIAGEPMEILVNEKLVAMGEVVVVNEKFGVRLTDVVSQFGLGEVESEKT